MKKGNNQIFLQNKRMNCLFQHGKTFSLDPITGTDQTNGNYWQRVHSYFMTHKDFQSNRNSSSLRHRWSMIQLAVNKFQGFYNQVDG